MKYRLKDNHPAVEAFNKLCQYADELGIYISFSGYDTTVRYDNKVYNLEDVDNFEYRVDEFPPGLEFKLTFEKGEKE